MRWLIAMFLAMSVTPALAAPATVQDYMAQPRVGADRIVAYGPHPAQVAELFLPKSGRGPFPVVVLIHGGCFLAEYQGLPQTSGMAADLAARGFAVWNLEYRKLGEPGAGFPGTFQDVAEGLDRLMAEAPKARLDLNRVVAVGHSAGGHLALWAAGRANLPRESVLWRARPLRLNSVLSLGGIGDLAAHGGVFAGACGPTLAQVAPPDTYAQTSPIALSPLQARVTMIHGEFDHVMPPQTGREFALALRAAGGMGEAVEIKGAGHFDPVMPSTAAWREVVVPAVERAAGRR